MKLDVNDPELGFILLTLTLAGVHLGIKSPDGAEYTQEEVIADLAEVQDEFQVFLHRMYRVALHRDKELDEEDRKLADQLNRDTIHYRLN